MTGAVVGAVAVLVVMTGVGWVAFVVVLGIIGFALFVVVGAVMVVGVGLVGGEDGGGGSCFCHWCYCC